MHAKTLSLRAPLSFVSGLMIIVGVLGCASTSKTSTSSTGGSKQSLYPRRPVANAGAPIADPPLQRPTIHLTLRAEGLASLLDALVPKTDTGSYALLGERTFTWTRAPFKLAFDDARRAMVATTDVQATVQVPGTELTDLTMKVVADVQPVITSSYQLALQAVTVRVTSEDRRIRVANWGAGLVQKVETLLQEKLTGLKIDLAPVFTTLDAKLAKPFTFKVGAADACFALDVRALEAGPSVLADGLEREIALVIAPSVTLPCAAVPPKADRALTPLRNAGSLEGGPFALTVPIAAAYDELQAAMQAAFTDGKLFFSADNPGLYVTSPEVFASDGQVVVQLKIGGFVEKGMRIDLDGELYLAGHANVRDNFLEFPDLRPTIDTSQALVNLALALNESQLTEAVRRALRLDLSARLSGLRQKLVDALSVSVPLVDGVPPLCTTVDVGRVEVSDLHAHDAYLRIYVKTTALAAASLPCAR